MGCSINRGILDEAKSLGYVTSYGIKNKLYSSGCTKAHVIVEDARMFLKDRKDREDEKAKLLEDARLIVIAEKQRLVDIETTRLADIESAKLAEIEMFNVLNLERIEREKQIQNQIITFNEQQNSGDFNDTPITEINLNNSCSECTGTKSSDPIPEKQLTENYLKIGGIAAVGVGILLLYTRSNKK